MVNEKRQSTVDCSENATKRQKHRVLNDFRVWRNGHDFVFVKLQCDVLRGLRRFRRIVLLLHTQAIIDSRIRTQRIDATADAANYRRRWPQT